MPAAARSRVSAEPILSPFSTNSRPRGEEQRGFLCTVCSRSFARLEHLNRHQRAHRRDKPFRCPICDLASSRKDAIRRHVKNMHGDSIPDKADSTLSKVDSISPSDFGSLCRASLEQDSNCWGQSHTSNTSGNGLVSSEHAQILHDPTASLGASTRPHCSSDRSEVDMLESPISIAEASVPTWQHSRSTDMETYGPIEPLSFDFLEDWIFPFNTPTASDFNPCSTRYVRDEGADYSNRLAQDDIRLAGPTCFQVSLIDLEKANVTLRAIDVDGKEDCTFPSRYRTMRYLRAYFDHFSPHVPIVSQQTFRLSTAHPLLSLAILACGAIYSHERPSAEALQKTGLRLLDLYNRTATNDEKHKGLEPWELKCRLLFCFFGVFNDNARLQGNSTAEYTKVLETMERTVGLLPHLQQNNWYEWLEHESLVRCISFCIILGAIISSHDRQSCVVVSTTDIHVQLPASEEDWTVSRADWNKPPEQHYTISSAVRTLLDRQDLPAQTSAFGLVTLIAALHCQVSSLEAASGCLDVETYKSAAQGMEVSLALWEDKWKTHPYRNYSPTSIHGPLMADALPILNSTYFHLYCSKQLKLMKNFLLTPSRPATLTTSNLDKLFQGISSTGLGSILIRAGNSLQLRARYGVKYLRKTASLTFTPYTKMSGFECGILLAWYILARRAKHPIVADLTSVASLLDEVAAELEESGVSGSDTDATIIAGYLELYQDSWIWGLSESFFQAFQRVYDIVSEST